MALVYFVGVRPGWYRPIYPSFVMKDFRHERRVLVSPSVVDDFGPGRVISPPDDELERRYVTREVRTRLHQARFRWLVLPAYHEQCAICRLKEVRLLDAAHIVPDRDPAGTAGPKRPEPVHDPPRAFDHDLVGIDPSYRVQVSRRLRDEDDGPMLDLLNGFHGERIVVPHRAKAPDPDKLAVRFERFLERG